MRSATPALRFVTQAAAASAVMTASQHIEIAITHRDGSDLPVRVMERLIGRSIRGAVARTITGQITQFGLAASAVALARVLRCYPPVVAVTTNTAFLALGNASIANVLDVGDPIWTWSRPDLATDLTHKTSLATAAMLITRSRSWPL